MRRQRAARAQPQLADLAPERLAEADRRQLERRTQARRGEPRARAAPALAQRAELTANEQVDEQHRPVEHRDLRARREAPPRDAVAREHVAAAERLEAPLGRRGRAERLPVLVQRAGAARAHAAMAGEPQAQRQVDVLPVREERLVEAADVSEGLACERRPPRRTAPPAPRRARAPTRAGSTPRPTSAASCRARSRPSRRAAAGRAAAGRRRPSRHARILQRLEQPLEEVRLADDVVVDQHDDVGLRGCHPAVDGPAEADVRRQPDEAHTAETAPRAARSSRPSTRCRRRPRRARPSGGRARRAPRRAAGAR